MGRPSLLGIVRGGREERRLREGAGGGRRGRGRDPRPRASGDAVPHALLPLLGLVLELLVVDRQDLLLADLPAPGRSRSAALLDRLDEEAIFHLPGARHRPPLGGLLTRLDRRGL